MEGRLDAAEQALFLVADHLTAPFGVGREQLDLPGGELLGDLDTYTCSQVTPAPTANAPAANQAPSTSGTAPSTGSFSTSRNVKRSPGPQTHGEQNQSSVLRSSAVARQ